MNSETNAQAFEELIRRFYDRHPEIRRAVERRRKAQEAPRRRVCLDCGGEGGTWDVVPGDERGSARTQYRTCRTCAGSGWLNGK